MRLSLLLSGASTAGGGVRAGDPSGGWNGVQRGRQRLGPETPRTGSAAGPEDGVDVQREEREASAAPRPAPGWAAGDCGAIS